MAKIVILGFMLLVSVVVGSTDWPTTTLTNTGDDAVVFPTAGGKCAVDSEALKLAPCLGAAQSMKAPVSSGCCATMKKNNDPPCLCAALMSKAAKAAGINPAIAITIPKRCAFSDRPVGYKCGAYTLP